MSSVFSSFSREPNLTLFFSPSAPRYFHYSGSTFPPHFLPQVFYHLPNLEHFLSQADATSILDADIDATKPRPKLVTLEIDPGVHDGEGRYVDARVERWCDLEKLR